MFLIIICPSCEQQSQNPFDKVPDRKLRITCKGCGHQFPLDKIKRVNCRIKMPEKERPKNTDGWKVDVPACSGMVYDLAGMQGLISSGLVGANDNVLAPGQSQWRPAGEIDQLVEAIRKKEEAVRRAEQRGL